MNCNILPATTLRIGTGGGDMDETLKRLCTVEADVAGIKAQIPYLATKSDVSDLKASIGDVRTSISEAKISIIQWIVGTAIAIAALAFTIAKFVH